MSSGVVPTPALAYLARNGPFAAGIMVSASHNPADDNGLKVLDADGLKLDDAIEEELEQLIWREGELGGVGNAAHRPADRRPRRGRGLPRPSARDGRVHRRLRADGRPRRRERLRWSATGPAILGRDRRAGRGDPRGARRRQHQRPTVAPPTRPSWPRRSSPAAPMSGFALDGDADRLIAVDAQRRDRGWRPDPGDPRPRAPRRATPCRAGWSSRCCPTAACRRRWSGPAAASSARRSGTSTSSRGCSSSGATLGGEKSGHVIVLEHTTSGDGIVTALEVLRVMCGAAPVARRPRVRHPAPAPATARGARPSQGPVGRRPGPGPGHRRGDRPAGRSRSGARPSVRDRARAAGDGRRARTARSSWSSPTRSRPSRGSVYTSGRCPP